MNVDDVDVVVIGAGIAGLMAANILQKQGISVIVLDKGPGVGGRMATRQMGPGRGDIGAQFFTVRSQEFRNWISQWQYEKLVYLWAMGWGDGSLMRADNAGHPRYAVAGGMGTLPEHLARDLDHVYTNARVMTVTAGTNGWLIQDENGEIYTGRALLATPPVPQSLEILRAGATRLSADDLEILERISYAPCLCGLFWVDGPLHLPEPGAIQKSAASISWIADNQRKGISPEATIVTVHASPDYSQQLWNTQDSEVLEALRSGLKPYLEAQTKIREAHLERWRYSLPTVLHNEPYLLAEGLPPLVFAGDAFGSPRVEGAALSGTAAARALQSILCDA